MNRKVKNGILVLIALICLLYPIDKLIVDKGFFCWSTLGKLITAQMLEVAIWFLIALLGIRWHNLIWILGTILVFSYAHVMLLPMLLAVFYCIFTILVGSLVSKYVFRQVSDRGILQSYFWGIIILTILYALLSLIKEGSIRNIKIVDSVIFIGLCIFCFKSQTREKVKNHILGWYHKGNVSKKVYAQSAVIMCFLLIAIGRANISLDYDSAWYGIRSRFVLDNMNGIYDNLKLVGCVYTYSKGYETYVLPLNWESSYGFVYAGNIIFAAWVIYIAYKICRIYLSKECALWGAVFVSAIPGIMNMSITAKSDIMTLFVQLISIYFALLFLREKKSFYFGMVMASFIYAQTLKPTAVVFSTSILLAFMFVCVVYKIRPCFGKKSIELIILSVLDLGLIWYRTFLFTGKPANSVWGKLFGLLGMKDKYPYNSGQISQFNLDSLFDMTTVKLTVSRIKEFLFAPNSGDMDHIIIAWGTTLCTFFMIVFVLGIIFNFKKSFFENIRKADVAYAGLLVLGEFVCCIISLWMGSKPDGNYFMLYYSVVVIFGTVYMYNFLIPDNVFTERLVTGIWICFLPLNMVFTGATNWAWISSFNKIDWCNSGYYNHKQEFENYMNQLGCNELYDIMTSSPHNKVYALAEHPSIERIPCVIETELDVSCWGNQELVSSSDNFIQFVKYEAYDYIYIAPGYLKRDSVSFEYLCQLFEKDMVASIIDENGHVLLEMGETKDFRLEQKLKEEFLAMF